MKIRTSKDLGNLVRHRRKELKVTQKQLAMICGTGLRFIIDLEKGKPTCQTSKALLILGNLGIQIHTSTTDNSSTAS